MPRRTAAEHVGVVPVTGARDPPALGGTAKAVARAAGGRRCDGPLSRSAGPNSRRITRRISNVSRASVRGAVAGTAVPFLRPSGAQISGKADVTCS
jgi:hypothetical protein